MKEDPLVPVRRALIENLETLKSMLVKCVGLGMVDTESAYYNEILDLLEDAHLVTTWDEVEEIVTLAKTIEIDIDAWGAIHGQSSISLTWPRGLRL